MGRIRHLAITLAAGAALLASQAVAAPAYAQPGSPPEDCRLPVPVGNELPPQGTISVIVLFVDFPDATPAPGERAQRVEMLDSEVADWFAASSYGQVSLDVDFAPGWHRMPASHTAYNWTPVTFATHQEYLQDAVNAADPVVNFTPYQMIWVVPPKTATNIHNSPAFVAGPGWGVWADGVELRHGTTLGQDLDFWGYQVVNHEVGHTFGLPDLYLAGPPHHTAVGGWDLMGLINGPAPDHFAWHKWRMSWLDNSQIACLASPGQLTATLTPLGSSGGDKALIVRTGPDTAVVVENRQVSTLDQASSCFVPGVLVYTLDMSPAPGQGPIQVVDRTLGVSVPGCHSDHAELDDATLTAAGHSVTADGVTVTLNAPVSGVDRTVTATW